MSCGAHCGAIDAAFDRRVAAWDLERYRRTGPRRSTRALRAAIREAGGAAGALVLDVGGGVGAVTLASGLVVAVRMPETRVDDTTRLADAGAARAAVSR